MGSPSAPASSAPAPPPSPRRRVGAARRPRPKSNSEPSGHISLCSHGRRSPPGRCCSGCTSAGRSTCAPAPSTVGWWMSTARRGTVAGGWQTGAVVARHSVQHGWRPYLSSSSRCPRTSWRDRSYGTTVRPVSVSPTRAHKDHPHAVPRAPTLLKVCANSCTLSR